MGKVKGNLQEICNRLSQRGKKRIIIRSNSEPNPAKNRPYLRPKYVAEKLDNPSNISKAATEVMNDNTMKSVVQDNVRLLLNFC